MKKLLYLLLIVAATSACKKEPVLTPSHSAPSTDSIVLDSLESNGFYGAFYFHLTGSHVITQTRIALLVDTTYVVIDTLPGNSGQYHTGLLNDGPNYYKVYLDGTQTWTSDIINVVGGH